MAVVEAGRKMGKGDIACSRLDLGRMTVNGRFGVYHERPVGATEKERAVCEQAKEAVETALHWVAVERCRNSLDEGGRMREASGDAEVEAEELAQRLGCER